MASDIHRRQRRARASELLLAGRTHAAVAAVQKQLATRKDIQK